MTNRDITSRPFMILMLLMCAGTGLADACRLETDDAVARAKLRMQDVEMFVAVCSHCENNGPIPLRIHQVEFKRHAPDSVRLPFHDMTFTVEDLRRAEETGSGKLADSLRAAIDEEYADETGYLPNDPFLIEEKRERFLMLLGFAREDLDMRTWEELWINGQLTDPARLYYPVSNDRYQNLGAEVGCGEYTDSPLVVEYLPIDRDPEKESPPTPFIADITDRCYDGSCPTSEWRSFKETPFYGKPDGESTGKLNPGETVTRLKTLSYVTGARAVAKVDHDHIFAGDVFYLLDSLAEGFYRFWHYGNVFVDDASGVRVKEAFAYCERDGSCWADQETLSTSVWWAKVQRTDGSSVWVREPLDTLHGVLVD